MLISGLVEVISDLSFSQAERSETSRAWDVVRIPGWVEVEGWDFRAAVAAEREVGLLSRMQTGFQGVLLDYVLFLFL